MLEPLRAIPGPDFLLYYLIAMPVVTFLVRSWAYNDGSTDHMAPQLTRVDPYAIAALRGGAAESVKVALFDLERQGVVKLSGEGADIAINTEGAPSQPLNLVAQETYNFISSHPAPRDMFSDTSFLNTVEGHLASYYSEMQARHLMRNEDQHFRAWMALAAGFAILWSVGGAKLYLGIIHDKPYFFLICLLAITLGLIWWGARPMDRLTALGRKHLSDLQGHFGWVKDSLQGEKRVDDMNVAFALALFGGGAFAGGMMYDLYNKAAIPLNQRGVGGCSGCSGGGGCGGGCGGCGGCG